MYPCEYPEKKRMSNTNGVFVNVYCDDVVVTIVENGIVYTVEIVY